VLEDLRAGWRFVRTHTWCWAILSGTALALMCWNGPVQVLLPYVVKYDLHAGATGLGIIFAAGGVGSILTSFLAAQLGMPRHPVAVIFLAGTVAVSVMAGYGVMTALWQGMLVAFVTHALAGGNSFIWDTLLQREVPRELLGRVSSIDWFIFTGLLPLSLALAGPVASVVGVRQTLVAGGLLGGVAMGAFCLVPGVQNLEGRTEAPAATT
jgi:DHA3 family tetracycline resistance protein-like MFS transporter